jgi:hypothetical protein
MTNASMQQKFAPLKMQPRIEPSAGATHCGQSPKNRGISSITASVQARQRMPTIIQSHAAHVRSAPNSNQLNSKTRSHQKPIPANNPIHCNLRKEVLTSIAQLFVQNPFTTLNALAGSLPLPGSSVNSALIRNHRFSLLRNPLNIFSRAGVQSLFGRMAALNFRKLFRESHRDLRLRPMRFGETVDEAVRPLALTAPLQKLITIKDLISRIPHEESIAASDHAPSLS